MAQPTQREYMHYLGLPVSQNSPAFTLYPNLVDPQSLDLRSNLPTVAGAATVGAVAYWVFLGRLSRRLTAQKVLFAVTSGGASTQVGEVGIFSSPTAPNRAAQTLTKIVATGTLDDLTGTGVLGNTTAFAQDVDAGTFLWAGYRVDMASTEPSVQGLGSDLSQGRILSLAAATAFTSGTTYAGVLITHALTWQAPALILTVS